MLFDEQNQDPKYQQLTKMIEQLQGALNEKKLDHDSKVDLAVLKENAETHRHHESIKSGLIKEDMKEGNKVNLERIRALANEVLENNDSRRVSPNSGGSGT